MGGLALSRLPCACCWVPQYQGPPYCSLLSVSHQPARPHYSTTHLFPPHPQAIKKWSYAFMAVKLQQRMAKSRICKETCVWDFQQWLSNSQLQAPRAEPVIFAETLYVPCNSFTEKAPKPHVRRKPSERFSSAQDPQEPSDVHIHQICNRT